MGNMLMDGIIKRARDLVRRGEKREQTVCYREDHQAEQTPDKLIFCDDEREQLCRSTNILRRSAWQPSTADCFRVHTAHTACLLLWLFCRGSQAELESQW
ncbi:hypothetical protein RRG08_029448 [Elysia crispata]|uniref:Uncharacterized protein n=1 Tax=Elysia crispata TaxID=231223 RepID=A0AAE1BEU8_9GAST|nr:hypothetical protein RRG08_029448 [Elysia crispata]